MKKAGDASRHAVVIYLCSTLMVSLVPRPAEARETPVKIEIGQPAVWSLGQAHYLLASMHERNRQISTRLPTEDQLDPNRANASQIDALRSALGVEVQFDQAMGVKNQVTLDQTRQQASRQSGAQSQLAARRAGPDPIQRRISNLNEQIAVLEEQD